jgi:tetratricopeptide (TPR) repeat protein
MRTAILLIAALCAAGCGRKAIVKSPYQQSVEAYYRDLDAQGAGGSFAETEKALSAALAANPSDMEARALRANIYMLRWTVGNDAAARAKLVNDLKTLHYGAQAANQADWVRPRVLIILGDLMLRSGNSLAADGQIHQAKGYYQEASRHYAAAHALASGLSNPSPGAVQEKANAFSGYVQAQRGVLDMLTRVRQETNVVERLVSRWVSSLHNTLTTGAVTATQDTTLGVDIQQLTAAKRTFEDMANREQNSMLDWCKTHPNPPPSDPAGVDALVKAIDLRERQLGKELVLQLLTDAPSSSAGDLEFLYKGVAEVCR